MFVVSVQVKEENPSASFGELAKIVSERWKAVSPDEKKEYEDKAKQVRAIKYSLMLILARTCNVCVLL